VAKKPKPASSGPAQGAHLRRGGSRLPKLDTGLPGIVPPNLPFLSNWTSIHSYLVLAAATMLSLLPFSGKAFNVDDTLFLFSAKQIVQHPFDPYGFDVVWAKHAEHVYDVTMNPPLACYYAALTGRIAGWSERALHLAFLLPALALVLGSYRLAAHWTRFPLLAALAVLLTPGVLVSATSVMCDTMMTALWVWAVVLWVEGLDGSNQWYLLASSVLIATSALSKYFGIALIPLLLVYSVVRMRRIGWWALYFAIPLISLVGYELWTSGLYGHGLIEGATAFSSDQRAHQHGSTMAHVLVSLSFAGGCAAIPLTLAPLLWSRKHILVVVLVAALAATSVTFNWVDYGARVQRERALQSIEQHWALTLLQLTLCIAAGLFILALSAWDLWVHKNDAAAWLLGLWVIGTWFFAGFVNWTVNARSVLPLIPAVGILIFRRLQDLPVVLSPRTTLVALASGISIAAVVAFVVTASDVAWANSAREAADAAYQKIRTEHSKLYFLGHWGFQYYMQAKGVPPGDEYNTNFQPGDLVIAPANNTEIVSPPAGVGFAPYETMHFSGASVASTMNSTLGAGFYASFWGPLPFAFGKVPLEDYHVGRVVLAPRRSGDSPRKPN